jgi:hypothetical protein
LNGTSIIQKKLRKKVQFSCVKERVGVFNLIIIQFEDLIIVILINLWKLLV